MKINNMEVLSQKFAYCGCHKIYLIESLSDETQAIEMGYELYPIENLKDVYKNSCSLKFISNWQLNKTYVSQFEKAKFRGKA